MARDLLQIGLWNQTIFENLASEFNIFVFTHPNEPTLSAIIAELLNPNGKHGQGDLFLNEFLSVIGRRQLQGSPRVKVTCEDRPGSREGTRRPIDITLDFDGTYCIGIENKPWAREQLNQVRDYCSQLADKYHGKNWLLVYISPQGAGPESIEKEEKERLGRKISLFYRMQRILGVGWNRATNGLRQRRCDGSSWTS